METHSRILIQNCVLDILLLTLQMLAQVFYITDNKGNTIYIITDGILIYFMKEKFNPLFFYCMFIAWIFMYNLSTNGLCVQFIYRYLVLNRNMKLGFSHYLYMFLVALIIISIYIFDCSFFTMPYSAGGVQLFSEFNKTLPYFQCGMENMRVFAMLPLAFVEIIPYFIIIICGSKMVKYVNLHTGFDQNMKRLLKQLTETLIILAVVPFVKHATILILLVFSSTYTSNNAANIIRLIIFLWFHFTPVFNSIVCILTNKPYRNAVFKSIKNISTIIFKLL
uniref:Uncharacterized protein n=1 Tax=Meloidogyne enterolobii TaxID=390850 RepID=A0A6V7UPD4_MELEN|nr:unnamed protein product [Meloidogyne enterolobii]